jgi:hypothetical protein
VIVAEATWPKLSSTTYFTGVAVPANVGNGLNVTTPVVVLTVYVPSPETVNVVNVQVWRFVSVFDEQKRTEVASNVAPVAAASPVSTSIT